ncbi:hypothetical protein BB559_007093 [Furculomyces boomerangus]|uniref:Peptidase A1 domain-containing protein n=2 Tax=Harpellales TaxID=61421 RepID=A0A2T9XZ27_9FUNG|nr:hypothetical protein BB559_007586 [Furculomyces boomerangus]PVU85315.1 hypothetical protein BB559_007093 [Furculomyces boomerangus]PVZ99425.1 hypothetical protein BB558_004553 [Smittium angustum]
MIFKTLPLAAFAFQFMNLGIAVPNQSVAIPVKNFKNYELSKRTDNENQENLRVDIDMIKGHNGYYVELGVGSPQQNLRFQIDTESYIQLITSDNCDSCFHDPENRRMFTGIDTESYTDSDFFKFNGFGISFGGYLPTEPLCLKKGTSEDIEFAALNTTSKTIESVVGYDGVIGIGYPMRYAFQENINFRNFFIEKFLKNDRIISINLKPGVEKISLGYQNKEKTSKRTIWVNQIEGNTFKFSTPNVKIGVTGFQHTKRVIVNPLYQKIYLQRDQVSIIDSYITNSQNCMNINTLPTITFTLVGRDLTLEPKDYISFNNGVCESSIEEIDSSKFGRNLIILGQNFLKKYVVTFDYDYGKIGFTE